MTSDKRNEMSPEFPSPGRPHVRMRLPAGITGHGFVTVRLANRAKVRYELKPRYARVLYALAKRWSSQEGDDYEADERGWCTIEQLLDVIDSWTDYRPTEDALRRYIGAIVQIHNDAMESIAAELRPPLIERRRQLGARVAPAVEFEVICSDREPVEASL